MPIWAASYLQPTKMRASESFTNLPIRRAINHEAKSRSFIFLYHYRIKSFYYCGHLFESCKFWVEAKCFVFTIMSASDDISGYKGCKKIPLANCKRKRIPTKKSIRGRFWWTKWINVLTLFNRPLKGSHCF